MGADHSFLPKKREKKIQKMSHAPMDFEHLAQMTMNDEKLAVEVLGLFRSQSASYFAQLCAANSGDDWLQAAHALKGAARSIGALKVADVAEAAECLSFESSETALNDVLKRLENMLAEADQIIEKHI